MTFQHSYPSPPRIIAPGGPVVLALRALREMFEAPPRTGPVTDAIRTMRAALPDFDADPDVRILRRAIADRIQADISILDFLGGDADDEPSLCGACSTHFGGTLEPSTAYGDDREQDAGDEPELENEHGGDIQDEPHDEEPDLEPSLGSLAGTGASLLFCGFSFLGQTAEPWAGGSVNDYEDENEHGTDGAEAWA